MTLIIAFLATHLGFIATAIGGLGALIIAFATGRAKATAAAQPKIEAAQTEATTAKAALAATATRVQVEEKVATVPDADLDAELSKLGALRKD